MWIQGSVILEIRQENQNPQQGLVAAQKTMSYVIFTGEFLAGLIPPSNHSMTCS
jgi:hypothetical protein